MILLSWVRFIPWYIMAGAACGAGNAYPSGAPDFTSGFHRGSCCPVICVSLFHIIVVFWVLIVPFVWLLGIYIFYLNTWARTQVLELVTSLCQTTESSWSPLPTWDATYKILKLLHLQESQVEYVWILILISATLLHLTTGSWLERTWNPCTKEVSYGTSQLCHL